MQDYRLGFIDNRDIYNHVKSIVDRYRFNITLDEFNKNLLDPIKLTFDSKVYSRDLAVVIESEIMRQIDKSNNNHIGYFHQNIFQYISNGWEVPKTGFDIINSEHGYFVEMKNKHNTMNSSSSQKTFMRMQNALLKRSDAVCILVEAIAPKSQDVPWKVRLDGDLVEDERIRRMSIDRFYALVTGDKLAFKKLCERLPQIIDDVTSDRGFCEENNSVLSELQEIDSNLLKSIYLLAFKQYE